MTILTKSRLKTLVCTLLFSVGGRASALNTFECVRGLMPITEPASFSKRVDVEKPFVAEGKYLVFPEVKGSQLAGFYIYLGNKAWHFDSIQPLGQTSAVTRKLEELPRFENQVYKMIAQTNGAETLTLEYMPGFLVEDPERKAPVVLGASVLPVVGAFVSRPKARKEVYNDPTAEGEDALKSWVYHRLERRPADASAVEVPRMMMRLKSQTKSSAEAMWAPLRAELKIRKEWIQEHNLDEKSFRQLSALMAGACHE
jgi:hypothetical protein